MKLPVNSTEIFNIVVVGTWNTSIFSPQWAKENLANDQEKEVVLAIPALFNMSPNRLTVDDVNIYPSTFTLMFDCVSFSDASIQSCVDKVKKISNLLSHTPVSGLGINFKFIVGDEESATLSNLFNFDDSVKIDSNKFIGLGAGIKRSFGYREGFILNITVDKLPQGYQIEFNFHFDAKKLNEIENCLTRCSPNKLRIEAIEFMKNVYGVELMAEDEND